MRLGTVVVAAVFTLASNAHAADPLTADEIARLTGGDTITRPENYEDQGRRYVGGVAYTVVDATSNELLALFDRDDAWLDVLPRTKHVEKLGGDATNLWMLLHQGNSLVDASYVLHVQKEPTRVRFWMDLTRPHDVEDAWGFFRWQEIAPRRLLVTYGALVDLGIGMLRSLYEERLRAAMLDVPRRLRQYVARASWESASSPSR